MLAGTTTLTAANTYTGGTTISAGILQLGNGGTSGSITGDVTNNGIFAINRSNALSFGGVISGTGAFQQNGSGTTILTAANTYTGGTTISAGILQLGNGGTTGSITGDVTNNGIFAINRSNAFSFDGMISGTGAFQQNGSGTTILTGDNSYSGTTNVNAGTLRAGAMNTFSPNSAVTVASGGTLDLNGFDQTLVSVSNAGLVNMGTGTAPGTVLTTTDYAGNGGTIALNTFLGGDNSPSDRLVINGGTASGTSGLLITNAGGPGDLTLGNGIPVVVTTNGGTTAPGAFGLSGPVGAGPYEYFLFRGGVTPGNENDLFLRNVAGPIAPEQPGRRAGPHPAGPTVARANATRNAAGPNASRHIAGADPVLPPGGGRLCRDAGAGALDGQRDPRDLSRTPGRPEPPDQEWTRADRLGPRLR